MLLYKSGRFYVEGVSFQIPDGFYVETDPDLNYEEGLSAWNPSCSCLYLWMLDKGCADAKTELHKIVDSAFTPYSEVGSIVANGLSGCFILYGEKKEQYYEARFDLGRGKQFALIVEARKDDIHKVIKSSEFQTVLDGIRAEQVHI